MPLSEFIGPAITEQYLKQLDMHQLSDLLMHKTNGLLVATRIRMQDSDIAKNLRAEVQKIQNEINARSKAKAQ